MSIKYLCTKNYAMSDGTTAFIFGKVYNAHEVKKMGGRLYYKFKDEDCDAHWMDTVDVDEYFEEIVE